MCFAHDKSCELPWKTKKMELGVWSATPKLTNKIKHKKQQLPYR